MISRVNKMLLMLLVGAFPALCSPALCSLGLAPCCISVTTVDESSSCCNHHLDDDDVATPVAGCPLNHHGCFICSNEFVAIQGSAMTSIPPAMVSSSGPFHLYRGGVDLSGSNLQDASGECLSGRSLRVLLSSLIC